MSKRSSHTVKLRLFNYSWDVTDSDIIIFQKNVVETLEEIAFAWRVIKRLGFQCSHSFTYSHEFEVGVRDAWGNDTPNFLAAPGQRWEMLRDYSGNELRLSHCPATSYRETEIYNSLDEGSITARIYRDGLLVTEKANVSPGMKAVFRFEPRIYIGIASQVDEGDVVDAAVLSDVNTSINLSGLRSADIIMSGRGQGPEATRLSFALANVNAG